MQARLPVRTVRLRFALEALGNRSLSTVEATIPAERHLSAMRLLANMARQGDARAPSFRQAGVSGDLERFPAGVPDPIFSAPQEYKTYH